MINRFFDWLSKQLVITRLGIYYLAVIVVFFIARGISILLGWNKSWV